MIKNKQLAFYVAIVMVATICSIGIVKASTKDNLIDRIVERVSDKIVGMIVGEQDNTMGASGDSNLTNLVLSGDLTVGDDTTFTDDVSVGGDITVTGASIQGTVKSDFVEGSCADATTTVFAFVNPESSEIIVDYFYINVTNGTSTGALTIGTSSSQYLTADPSDTLVDDLSLASSTAGTATTTAKTYNTNGTVTADSGFQDPGTNSENKIVVGASDYIAGYFDTLYAGALTEVTNIFSCTYRMHYYKME